MSQSDFVSRGQALVAAGQFQEAVKVCRLGLLGRPTTVEGRVVLGQALLALKRFDEVLAEMRVALELDHTSVPAQVLRAEALLRKGDTAPAIEALHKARHLAPGDPRILQLLGEAEQGAARQSVSHPAVSFVGSGDTKHYPGHSSGGGGGNEDGSTEHFTKQTSLSSPGGARRSSQRQAAVDPFEAQPAKRRVSTPSPDVLGVGDKSGTVEVDPELEGVELDNDADFDEVAAPPKSAQPASIGGGRGSVRSSSRAADGERGTIAGKKSAEQKVSTPTMALDLDEEDDVEFLETRAPEERPVKRPSKGTAVRNAVAMPSGVIGEPPGPSLSDRAKSKSVPPPRSKAPSAAGPPLAQTLAAMPGAVGLNPPAPPLPPAPRGPLAAALPTMAAAQPPPPFVQSSPFSAQGPSPFAAHSPASNMPTMAIPASPLNPAQQQSAAAVDQLFGNEPPPPPSPVWARPTMAVSVPDPRSMAAANEPTARPGELDPAILAMMSGSPSPQMHPGAMALDQVSLGTPPKGQMRTGMRRTRSRLQIVLWIVVGIAVIGGGVFAGFQIRAMRLKKQIAIARSHATDLAKADTFGGWTAARDSLSGIVQASATADNRAALARARALVAYVFGDGVPEATQAAVDAAPTGNVDSGLASAYLALATNDVAAAKLAAQTTPKLSSTDPAVLYATGELAMFLGDPKAAVTSLKAAADKEARPLYGIALAKAQAAVSNWDEAIAALDRVLAGNPDHPEAVIARGNILAAAGRIAPGNPLGNEMRAQLERILYEGKRPVGEQTHGVSPTELAMGFLALSHVDYARGDINAARRDLRAAADVNLDDQRFAEESIETLIMFGDYTLARSQLDALMKQWPTSRRGRIALAQIYVAQGHAADAIELLAKAPDVLALPMGTVVHGYAQLAGGDAVNAAADFDAVLKRVPTYEPAVIGRAWIDLAAGDVDAAAKRTAERFSQRGSSVALTTAYAAALRRSADPAQRDRARELLEKVVAGPPGPDTALAHLELARIYRDIGSFLEARTSYTEAGKTGSVEARLEHALLVIEDHEPNRGHTMIEALLKEAGNQPSGQLVIEAVRIRQLMGDHAGASQLLELADKMSSIERWKLDRERGRLSMRRSKFTEAAAELSRALDTCGSDVETFLLASEVGLIEAPLADKVKKLVAQRLKGRPEEQIILGKQLLSAGKDADAEVAYKKAQEALRNEKASRRRQAQADFGLAVIAVNRGNNVEALNKLELVIGEDPTLVDAYVFAASIGSNKKKALERAQTAAELNPEYPYAWQLTGELAAKVGDKKALAEATSKLKALAPDSPEYKAVAKLR
ncbi:MAG TPA: tetratricopeptide repeat protein [Kofleriaceae bacterium]|nr:tetratricopeptide repeat protein [Kofleriaceae bacterium]